MSQANVWLYQAIWIVLPVRSFAERNPFAGKAADDAPSRGLLDQAGYRESRRAFAFFQVGEQLLGGAAFGPRARQRRIGQTPIESARLLSQRLQANDALDSALIMLHSVKRTCGPLGTPKVNLCAVIVTFLACVYVAGFV